MKQALLPLLYAIRRVASVLESHKSLLESRRMTQCFEQGFQSSHLVLVLFYNLFLCQKGRWYMAISENPYLAL